jgi:phosphoribosylamine--glycine ligase
MDVNGLLRFAMDNEVGLTVVGPEAPLVAGLVDTFTAQGLQVFGPDSAAAQLEGSKVFAKRLMEKYHIPTAASRIFSDSAGALNYLKEKGAPVVVKADGLAAGKGVIVARTLDEAENAVHLILKDKAFGDAGNQVVIEDFLEGEEVSVLAFTDGETVVPMLSSQDHKAAYDNDTGPNTGGMGAYSPAPVLTDALLQLVEKEILQPTIRGLRKDGIVYKGILYAGLMITGDGPKVLEYNVRFGDPECQAVLPCLQSDLLTVMMATVNRGLEGCRLTWYDRHAACVVMASGGYPGAYEKGREIKGLGEAAGLEDVFVFHAGTVLKGSKTVTAGGRVLGVTAWGATLQVALDKAYAAAGLISFKGAHYRKDIGYRALRRSADNS